MIIKHEHKTVYVPIGTFTRQGKSVEDAVQDFDKEINDLLSQGWKYKDGITILQIESHLPAFIQAMVRDTPVES